MTDSEAMPDPSDMADALVAAVAGDRRAIAVLWRSHNPSVLRYLRARNAAEPDDLAQQVWLDVARGLPRFSGDLDGFRGWLFTIVFRRLADQWRAPRGRFEVVTEPPEQPISDPHSIDSLDWAINTVRRLPDSLADAVLLRVVANLDVDQVAEILGLEPGAVRVRVSRGLAKLREILTPVEIPVTNEAASTMNGGS